MKSSYRSYRDYQLEIKLNSTCCGLELVDYLGQSPFVAGFMHERTVAFFQLGRLQTPFLR